MEFKNNLFLFEQVVPNISLMFAKLQHQFRMTGEIVKFSNTMYRLSAIINV